MFIEPATFFQNGIILDSFESPPNVSLGYAMFESRSAELDVNVHIKHALTLPQKIEKNKRHGSKEKSPMRTLIFLADSFSLRY
jgi:hypothetical protein